MKSILGFLIACCIGLTASACDNRSADGHNFGQNAQASVYQATGKASPDTSSPNFSPTTKALVTLGALLGALKVEGGLLWCIFFLIGRSKTVPGRAARLIAAVGASGAAFVAMAFISLDRALTAIFLIPAWSSPFALLFVVLAGSVAGYWGARAIASLAMDLEGIKLEVAAVAGVSFLASVIAYSLVDAFLSPVSPASYMFSYILIGALGGILTLIVRLLIREDERLTSRTP
ncbi:MAG TPA: hypothetical protein VGO55_09245 [Allosphingosinicella sp.]|jgi:hypothetical protein|nr:hypothetical protein [Allosphingosinicella sp.]